MDLLIQFIDLLCHFEDGLIDVNYLLIYYLELVVDRDSKLAELVADS